MTTTPSRNLGRDTRRRARTLTRIAATTAATAALGGGLSLAAVAPAQAVDAASSSYQLISQPRPHCFYYHHLINGAWRGTAYRCDTSAAGNHAYQARVVCHDDIDNVNRTVGDPTPNHEPQYSVVDCPERSGPVRGGYRDPA